ncbi:MAG: co-chaperone GroES [Candidatus Sericytochromatia bacterium]
MAATATKIRPLGDRVVVKIVKEEKTAGGLVLPDTAQEKPQTGEIVAVGPGKMMENGSRAAMDVKEGEKVLFAKYSGTEVKLDGETYLLLAEKDILGVVS